MKDIKYHIDALKWFDKVNGNTYHAVNIYDNKTNDLLYSSGMQYGYGEQYIETSKAWLIKAGLLSKANKYNHEFIRNSIRWSLKDNCLQRELKALRVEA